MAEDTRSDSNMTLAELCQAIAAGRVGYTLRDGCYQVKCTDARRLALNLDENHPLLDFSAQPELFDALADEVGVEAY